MDNGLIFPYFFAGAMQGRSMLGWPPTGSGGPSE